MTQELLIATILLLLVAVAMLALVLRRGTNADLSPVLTRLAGIEAYQERIERSVKEEIGRNRQESAEQGRGLREEVQVSLKNSADSVVQGVDRLSAAPQQQLEDFSNQLGVFTQTCDASAAQLRLELTTAIGGVQEQMARGRQESADEGRGLR